MDSTAAAADGRLLCETLAFFDADGGVKAIDQLSGGQQNTNFSVTTHHGACRYVCRVPGVDAAEHGQTHAIVFSNAAAAHASGVAQGERDRGFP